MPQSGYRRAFTIPGTDVPLPPDSTFHFPDFVFHFLESIFHFLRNPCSTSSGIGIPLRPDYAVDETFIGGKAKNMHASRRKHKIHGRGPTDKVAVLGMIERGGRVHAEVVPNRKRRTLQKSIKRHVRVGASLFSDELASYKGLDALYRHRVINHAVQYVKGMVHINTAENFWSLLKRALGGTYVSVEPYHLFRYLDEQAYRFNEREGSDRTRFVRAMRKLVGKRLTYAELTGRA